MGRFFFFYGESYWASRELTEEGKENEKCIHSIMSFFFLSFMIIEVIADIMPKKPTVPLLIFVLTTISGKLVRARVGNKSPTICTNSNAMIFLSSSI
jgi:hypothetical protein